jgi:hypothetical protein
MNMPAQSEMVLAKCHVTAAAEDPNYRQSVRCGRHEMIADERTSITLRMYAERKGWNIGAVAVSLALRQAREGTRSIERRVTVSVALTAEQHEKLADICEKTPVTLAVKSGLAVRTSLSAEGSAPPTPQ